jgi:hypothetical protein
MSALNAITKWVPDDEDENGEQEEDSENILETPDKVQKHVNMVNFDEDKRGSSISTSLLVALFVCLLAIIIALLSAREGHQTWNFAASEAMKHYDQFQAQYLNKAEAAPNMN